MKNMKSLKMENWRGVDQMVENPELISSHMHTKITTIYKVTIYVNDSKTRRKDSLQLKI